MKRSGSFWQLETQLKQTQKHLARGKEFWFLIFKSKMVVLGFLDLLDFYLERNQNEAITSNAFDKDSTRRKSALRDIYSTQMAIHDVQSSRYQARQRRDAGRHQSEINKLGKLIPKIA